MALPGMAGVRQSGWEVRSWSRQWGFTATAATAARMPWAAAGSRCCKLAATTVGGAAAWPGASQAAAHAEGARVLGPCCCHPLLRSLCGALSTQTIGGRAPLATRPNAGDPPSYRRWGIQLGEWVACVVAARAICGTIVVLLGSVLVHIAQVGVLSLSDGCGVAC